MNRAETQHVRWPAERFFWAVVDAPGWNRFGPLPPGLVDEAAEQIPAPLEELHIVGAPLGNGQLIACAAKRDQLDQIEPCSISLAPESTPGGPGVLIDASRLELLVGAYEPIRSRRARFHAHATVAATVMLCAMLLGYGMHRRAEHWNRTASAASQARVQLAEQVMPGVPAGLVGAELEYARSLVAASVQRRPPDAAVSLAALLRSWPDQTSATPQSISVSESDLALSVSLEGDASGFLEALTAPEGWVLEDPQLNAARGVTRLTISMRPREGAAGEGGAP